MASIQFIATALKEARIRKNLTQRELSKKIHVPQGHISKIENGTVDLQASSLVEIARSLDLELMLIPRSLVMAVRTMQEVGFKNTEEQIPLYHVKEEDLSYE